MVPREDNASDHVLELLQPYTKENGGPLEVERVHFTPGRGNIIIKYEGESWRVEIYYHHVDVSISPNAEHVWAGAVLKTSEFHLVTMYLPNCQLYHGMENQRDTPCSSYWQNDYVDGQTILQQIYDMSLGI